MIRFPCPACSKINKTANEMAGKVGRCKCGERLRVPTPENTFTDSAAHADTKPPQPTVTIPHPAEVIPPEWMQELIAHADVAFQPQPPEVIIPNSPATIHPPSTPAKVELIPCSACLKRIADNSLSCPNCGAVQTFESRTRGRELKYRANVMSVVYVCIIALPILTCCLGGLFNKPSATNEKKWDMDKLNQDTLEVVRDPNKTILVPKDGSQPKVVQNPFPPSLDDD